MLRARSVLAALLFVLAGGCADRTAILVEVTSADLSIPTDIDSITIHAVSAFGSAFDRTYALSSSWPHSLTILPAPREGIGPVRIDVTGNLAGRFVVRRVVGTEFVPGSVRRVTVVLARNCRGIECADGIDCIEGMCVEVDPIDGGVSDAGLDAGEDAPGLDAPPDLDAPVTPMDAPMDDAPGLDAPPFDAGSDAAMPDAGSDAGSDAGMPDAFVPASDAGPGGVLFSELVEGSGTSNKALEIWNASATPLDLSTCTIRTYVNGATTSTNMYALSGTLAPGAVLVVCHGSAAAPLAPLCDVLGPTASSGAMAFNGDDAIELRCGTTTMDIIGQIGVDPGTDWGAPPTATAEASIRRLCSVIFGDTNGTDAFVPATEWLGTGVADDFSGLGSRGCP